MHPATATMLATLPRPLLMMIGIGASLASSCGTSGAAGGGGGGTASPGGKPPPHRVVFSLDSHQITKDGLRITVAEVRNLISTMPRPRGTPREPSMRSESPLSADTFATIWAALSSFDFDPWQKLTSADFEDLAGPSDTAYSNSFFLSVDDVEVISLSLPMGPPKDPVLRQRLDGLREDIERALRVDHARRMLAEVEEMPSVLRLMYGPWILYRQPERTVLHKYCLFPPDSEWLERALPDLERAATVNPGKLRVDRSTVEVSLDETDLKELWQELRKVDFVALAGLGRQAYRFREQPVTWSLVLEIEGQLVLNLQYADRELTPAAAAPLRPLQELFAAKLKHKLDFLRSHRSDEGAGTL